MKKLALILAFVILAGLGPPERMLLTGYSPAREEAFIQSQSPTADLNIPASEVEVGPIVHLLMEDNAASTAVVNKANVAINGTANRNTNAWSTASGKITRGFDFYNGSTADKIDLAADVIGAGAAYSFCAWAYIDSGGGGGSLGRFAANAADSEIFYTSSDGTIYYNGGSMATATWTASTWEHWCFVRGATFNIYRNGAAVGSAAAGAGAAIRYIGNRSDGTRAFDGKLDDVRIYDYALSPAQIAAIYNNGAGHQNLASKAKANMLTVDATPTVMSAQDKQGVEFYQSTAASRAILTTMNGRQALRFDGVDDYLGSLTTTGDVFAAGAKTVFISYRQNVAGYLLTNASTARFYIYVDTTPDANVVNNDGSADAAVTAVAALNKPHVVMGLHEGGNLYARVDATPISAAVASGDTSTLTSGLWIGSRGDASNWFTGEIQRIITFNKALSPYARDRISKHLCRQAGASCN